MVIAFGLLGYRLCGVLFFLYIVHSFLVFFFTSYNIKWTPDIGEDMKLTSGKSMCPTQKCAVIVYLVTFLGVVSCYFHFLCDILLMTMSAMLP